MNDKIYNIAIVDDTKEIIEMLSKSLSRSDKYKVSTYSNPLTAINNIDSKTDVVFLDIVMPQMDGLEALEKIVEKNPDIKVIMMTASSTLDRVLKAHKYGATHYIMKPFDSMDAIMKKLELVISL
ncbi:response regulator receiver protein [Arcobacter nitrofigilis DSM 7299]|uniref:Response regulator receiver protein n=1 Tax=Arcobacter nitrofigilis (strain ATCC 33309 / DSM 7299 / CCUG 15893 / LMG 7604 / NCTC 12251 / CI) TaxID=572480 RepID=D5V1D0_ARCNC|nr:response regulator [Arcobacter nitrofigilis]ADG94092.1 response regulator receiver protein [Arcobacter nitrofigilis DSM 7299]